MGKDMNSARYALTGLFLLLFTIVSTGLLLPGTAKAEEGYGPGTDRFKINLGAYFPAISTDMQVSAGDDNIDLEETLGLSDDETVVRLDGYWRFAERHRLGFGYYRLTREASTVFQDNFEIGGETWYAGAKVDSELNLDFYQLNYMYSFYQGEKWEIGGTIGAYWVRAETTLGLAAKLTPPDPPGGPDIEASERFESDTFEGPLPLIGLVFEYYITPKWMATFKGGYFQLTLDNYKGSITNLGASVEYQFTKTFGLGLGYDGFALKVEAEDSNSNDFASIEYKYHGFQLYGILRF